MKTPEENIELIRKHVSGIYWIAAVAFIVWILKLIAGFFLGI